MEPLTQSSSWNQNPNGSKQQKQSAEKSSGNMGEICKYVYIYIYQFLV